MLRGVTKNVALNPLVYKDLDETENFIPTHADLRNIVFTDAGNMKKRPGYLENWDLGADEQVESLIPEDIGYGVLKSGRIFRLEGTPVELTGQRLNGAYRPTHANQDNILMLADGGPPVKIVDRVASLLGGSPSNFRFIDRLGPYTLGCGHDDTELKWCASGNPENWITGDSGFANVQKGGKTDIIRNFKVLKKNRAYFFKGKSFEVWVNRGGSTPFVRTDTGNRGLGADYSLIREGSTLYWLGDDRRFYRLDGVITPTPISSPFEDYIQKLPSVEDCVGVLFEKEHLIKWQMGISGKTLVYDYKNDRWWEDNRWENGQFGRLPINSYMEINNKQYIGSYNLDGLIHEWSYTHKNDDGQDIRVYRRFTVRPSPDGRVARFNRIGIRLKRGVATSSVTLPKFVWRYRLDRSVKWSDYFTIDMGAVGDNDPYIIKTGLGNGREIELEFMETDSVDLLLTNVDLTTRVLRR